MKTFNKNNFSAPTKFAMVMSMVHRLLEVCAENDLELATNIKTDSSGVPELGYSIFLRGGANPVFSGKCTDTNETYKLHMRAAKGQIVSELCPPTIQVTNDGKKIACWKRLLIIEQNISDISPTDSEFIKQTQASKSTAVWVGYDVTNREVIRLHEGTENLEIGKVLAVSYIEVPVLGRVVVLSYKDEELQQSPVPSSISAKDFNILTQYEFSKLDAEAALAYRRNVEELIDRKKFTPDQKKIIKEITGKHIFDHDLQIKMQWLIFTDFDYDLSETIKMDEDAKAKKYLVLAHRVDPSNERWGMHVFRDRPKLFASFVRFYVNLLLSLKNISEYQVRYLYEVSKSGLYSLPAEQQRTIEVLAHKYLSSHRPETDEKKDAASLDSHIETLEWLGFTPGQEPIPNRRLINLAMRKALRNKSNFTDRDMARLRSMQTRDDLWPSIRQQVDDVVALADNAKTVSLSDEDSRQLQVFASSTMKGMTVSQKHLKDVEKFIARIILIESLVLTLTEERCLQKFSKYRLLSNDTRNAIALFLVNAENTLRKTGIVFRDNRPTTPPGNDPILNHDWKIQVGDTLTVGDEVLLCGLANAIKLGTISSYDKEEISSEILMILRQRAVFEKEYVTYLQQIRDAKVLDESVQVLLTQLLDEGTPTEDRLYISPQLKAYRGLTKSTIAEVKEKSQRETKTKPKKKVSDPLKLGQFSKSITVKKAVTVVKKPVAKK